MIQDKRWPSKREIENKDKKLWIKYLLNNSLLKPGLTKTIKFLIKQIDSATK